MIIFKHPIAHTHYPVVNSTQDAAKNAIQSWPADHPLLITANEQTAGNGTHEKIWLSPDTGNIYMSLCIPYCKSDEPTLAQIPFLIGLSLIHTLARFDIVASLKWVNDIFVNRQKIAGVLCESVPCPKDKTKKSLIVGIGLNVNTDQTTLNLIDQPAISMATILTRKVDPSRVMEYLLAEIELALTHPTEHSLSAYIDPHLAGKDEWVEILQRKPGNPQIQAGFLRGISSRGDLIIEGTDHIKHIITHGKLILSREGRTSHD